MNATLRTDTLTRQQVAQLRNQLHDVDRRPADKVEEE